MPRSLPASLLPTVLALALSGAASAQTYPPAMNLSRYMPATASTGTATAKYAVDGMVCEESRWVSSSATTPHWLEVQLPGTFEIGSANIVTGEWDAKAVANFSLQYWNGAAWVAIPGAVVTGNTQTQRQIVFASSVSTAKIRFYSDDDGVVAVKELAVFPPKADGGAHPIGTEIDIRSGMMPKITASSQNAAGQRPYLAYDGFAETDSRWISANLTTQHWLEYAFVKEREVAYAHVYTGLGTASPIVNYTLQYWDAATAAWVDIPGGSVTGNTSTENFLTFGATIRTTRVRLVSDDDGNIRVKELVFLPPNGGAGYPRGTGAVIGSPPSQRWTGAYTDRDGAPPFSDHFYQIKNRVAGLGLKTAPGGRVSVETANTSFAQQYHILLNIGTDTYRICNRANQRCLEVKGGSLSTGAVVQEGDYNALPYQQWRLVANGSFYELVNAYSGQLLTVNGSGSVVGVGLIQNPRNASSTQHWSFTFVTHFPKKGSSRSEVSGDFVERYDASHWYGWGLYPGVGGVSAANDPTHFQPMWWNNRQDRTEDLLLRRAEWAVSDVPKYLMGFNEPNHTDQANMSVQVALDEWSRMEQVKLPLVGPQHDYAWGSWYTSFFDQADAIGMRIDEGGGHIYPTSSSVNFDSFNNGVTDGYNAQNSRVQWVTEWNWVNWGGAATWTDDELYSVVAETLWRYENNPWVKRHEFFAFSWYWANGKPGALQKDGNILPLGRLYAGWDGDLTIRENTWYHIHNRSTHVQIQNNAGVPTHTTIDTVDASINWYLSAASAGRYHIVSGDGKRLAYDGATLSLAEAGTTGAAVEWALTPIQHGWHYLDHPATGRRLDSGATTNTLGMYANSNTWETLRWRFIKPYQANVIPSAWTGDANGTWGEGARWSGGFLPGAGNLADFSTLNITENRTATLAGPATVGSLKFADVSGIQTWTIAASGSGSLTLDPGRKGRPSISVANTAIIGAPLAGENGFDKSGAGTLVLAGKNPLSGTVNIDTGGTLSNDGAVRLAHPDALAKVDLLRLANTSYGISTLQLDGASGSVLVPARIEIGTRNHDVPAIQNLSGTNFLKGDIDLNLGGDRFTIRSDSGLLVMSGKNKYVATDTGVRTYAFTGAGDHLVSGPILAPDGGATVSLVKSGAGTLVLGAQNTYNGTTTVGGGTLVVDGSTGAGSTTVGSGATLGGRGTVRGFLIAQSGATVRVGGATPTVIAETVIDDFDGPLSAYTFTRLLDSNGGAANNTAWRTDGGALTVATSVFDGIEQIALTRTDVPLAVGQELRVDYTHDQLGSQDIGLYVGAETPLAGVRRDFVNIYVRDSGEVYSRGFDGPTELPLAGGAKADPEQLFIARTATNGFELGYYRRGVRTVLATRVMSSSSIGAAIGLYGDVRIVGVRGSLDNLAVADPARPPVADTLTVQGNFTLPSNGVLELHLASPRFHDRLKVQGQMNASGILRVRLFEGAPTPSAGDSYDLFDANGGTVNFASLDLPPLAAGLQWNTGGLSTGLLSVVDSAGTYAGWKLSHPFTPGTDAPAFDADADGAANALEWLAGTDPLAPESQTLPSAKVKSATELGLPSTGKTYLTLQARLRKTREGVAIVPQAAVDLASLDAPESATLVQQAGPAVDDGDFERVTYYFTTPLEDSATGRAFMRLKLEF